MKLAFSLINKLLLLLLFIVVVVNGVNVYVSPNGGGTLCTSEQPCSLSTALNDDHYNQSLTVWMDGGTYSCSGSRLSFPLLRPSGNQLQLLAANTTADDVTVEICSYGFLQSDYIGSGSILFRHIHFIRHAAAAAAATPPLLIQGNATEFSVEFDSCSITGFTLVGSTNAFLVYNSTVHAGTLVLKDVVASGNSKRATADDTAAATAAATGAVVTNWCGGSVFFTTVNSVSILGGTIANNSVDCSHVILGTGAVMTGTGGSLFVAIEAATVLQLTVAGATFSSNIFNGSFASANPAPSQHAVAVLVGGPSLFAFCRGSAVMNLSDVTLADEILLAPSVNYGPASSVFGGGSMLILCWDSLSGSLYQVQARAQRVELQQAGGGGGPGSWFNGGGGVFALVSWARALEVSMVECMIQDQQIRVDALHPSSVNGTAGIYVGGGAVFALATEIQLIFSIFQCQFLNQSLSVTSAFSPTDSYIGGGALYLFSYDGSQHIVVQESLFRDQRFDCSDFVGLQSSYNGGGALFHYAESVNLTVSVSRTEFSGQVAKLDYSQAGNMSLGGAAVYVYAFMPSNASTVHFQAEDSSFTRQNLTVIGAVGQELLNGAGAVYLHSSGTLVSTVSDCVFSSQFVNVSNSNASVLMQNGGAAMYVFSRWSQSSRCHNSVFAGQTLVASHSTTSPSGIRTALGGGALYFYSHEPNSALEMDAFNSSFQAQQTLLDHSTSSYCASGGGALYLLSGGTINSTLNGCNFSNQVTWLDNNTGYNGTTSIGIYGGGVARLYALRAVLLQLTGCNLHNVQLSARNSAQYSFGTTRVGGGALYVSAEQPLSSTEFHLLHTVFQNQSTVLSTFPRQVNQNGGGMMFVYGAQVNGSIVSSRFSASATHIEHNGSVYLSDSSVAGGAGIYVYSISSQQLTIHSSEMERMELNILTSAVSFCADGGAAIYLFSEADIMLETSGSQFQNNSLVLNAHQCSSNDSSGGGVLYANAKQRGANWQSMGDQFLDNTVHSSQIHGGQQTAIGGASSFILTDATALVNVSSSLFSNNSVLLSRLHSGDTTIVGGSAILTVGQRSIVFASTCQFVGHQILLPQVNVSGEISIGGALLAFSLSQHFLLQECVASSNFVLVQNVVAQSVYYGGSVLAIVSSQEALLQVVSTLFRNNGVDLYQQRCADSVVGGGAVFAVSVLGTLTYSLTDCWFNDSSVQVLGGPDVQISTGLTIGGGALLVSNQRSCATAGQTCQTIANSFFFHNRFSFDNFSLADSSAGFDLGGGALLSVSVDEVQLTGCHFEANRITAWNGGALFLSGRAFLSQLLFKNNLAQPAFDQVTSSLAAPTAGALFGRASVRATNISFDGNVAYFGGAVAAETGLISFHHATFTGNSANNAAGAVFMGLSAVFEVTSSIFENNRAQLGGALAVSDATLSTFTNCTFRLNWAEREGGTVLALLVSRVRFFGCQSDSSRSEDSAGAFALYQNAQFLDVAGIHVNNTADISGGFLEAHDFSSYSLNRTYVANSVAYRGGAIYQSGVSVGQLVDSSIEWCSASQYGGAIVLSAQSSLSDAQFSRNRLVGNRAYLGGGLYVEENSQFNISGRFLFDGNVAEYGGGALYVQPYTSNTRTDIPPVLIHVANVDGNGTGVALSGNEAHCGGAVYVNAEQITAPTLDSISDLVQTAARSNISQNHAVAVNGINECAGSGSVLFWDIRQLSDTGMLARIEQQSVALNASLGQNNVAVYNNTAAFGATISSTWYETRLELATPAYPGERFTLEHTVLDLFNQTIQPFAQMLINIHYNVVAIAVPEPVRSGGAILSALASLVTSISVPFNASAAVVATPLNRILFGIDPLLFQFQPCQTGYGYDSTQLECVPCPPGSYVLTANSSCQGCPPHASCDGTQQNDSRMAIGAYVDQGYYPIMRDNSDQFVAIRCPFDYCSNRANDVITNQSARCNVDSFRDGGTLLCGHCLPGYVEWDHECLPCANGLDAANVVKYFSGAFLGALFLLVASQYHRNANIKTLVVMWQVSSLFTYPRKGSYSALANTVIFSYLLGYRSCPFVVDGYGELAFSVVKPFFYFVMLLILFFLHFLICKVVQRLGARCCGMFAALDKLLSPTLHARYYVKGAILISIALFEEVLSSALLFLPTIDLENGGTFLVFQYPSLVAQGTQYESTRIVLMVFSALLCLAPLLAGLWIHWYNKRYKGNLKPLRTRGLDPWYIHYRIPWWESWMLLRRALFVAVFVGLVSYGRIALAKVVVAGIIVITMFIHHVVNPFVEKIDNAFEVFANITLLWVGAINITTADGYDDTAQDVVNLVALCITSAILIFPTGLYLFRSVRRSIANRWRAKRLSKERRMSQSSNSSASSRNSESSGVSLSQQLLSHTLVDDQL